MTHQLKHSYSQCWPLWLSIRPQKMRHVFCTNTWPKDLSYSQKCFQSCKLLPILHPSFCLILEFIYSHTLLDQKINQVLSVSNDLVILAAVQSIIQNMLASEDACQQPLLFLQTCGFGGLWRFAGPFTKVSFTAASYFIWFNLSFCDFQYNMMVESSELFVNCLEAMVETCLFLVEESGVPPSPRPYHLSSSMSSLTLGSPTDKGWAQTNP